MAFEPIQAKPDPLSLSNLGNSGIQKSVNKPQSLIDSIKSGTLQEEDGQKETDKKDRDKVELSPEAAEVLRATINTGDENVKVENNYTNLERDALEFRGLNQISRSRDLTEGESNKLNQIKQKFADIGIDDNTIGKIAAKKLIEIQQEAPRLVKQIDDGPVTGGQIQKLNNITESINKANGFGVSEQDQQAASEPQVVKVKNDFNSFIEVNKDRELSRAQVSDLEKLATQLSAIQGFQINVRETVGQDGVLV